MRRAPLYSGAVVAKSGGCLLHPFIGPNGVVAEGQSLAQAEQALARRAAAPKATIALDSAGKRKRLPHTWGEPTDETYRAIALGQKYGLKAGGPSKTIPLPLSEPEMVQMARGYQNEVIQVIFSGPGGTRRAAVGVGYFNLKEVKYTVAVPKAKPGETVISVIHVHPSWPNGRPKLRPSPRIISEDLNTGVIHEVIVKPK